MLLVLISFLMKLRVLKLVCRLLLGVLVSTLMGKLVGMMVIFLYSCGLLCGGTSRNVYCLFFRVDDGSVYRE